MSLLNKLPTSPFLEAPPVGDCSRSARRSVVLTVSGPTPSDQPAHDDDYRREGEPEVDDPPHPLCTPHQLLMSVAPGVRALHPTLGRRNRGRPALLGDLRHKLSEL